MDASSLQAELQRKKSELARLQQQVLRAETSRRSQRTRKKTQRSQTGHSKQVQKGSKSTVHDVDSGSEAAHSVDVKQGTTNIEPLLTEGTSTSTFSRKVLPKETINIPTTALLSQPMSEVRSGSSTAIDPLTVQDQGSGSSSTAIDPLTVQDQSRTDYKQEMMVLSQAGSLVRDSEDPHSPIWLKGLDYPAQYLVRQTRSMSAKISSQSSVKDATRQKETKGVEALPSRRKEESLQQYGGRRKRERGRKRKTKGDSPNPIGLLAVQRDGEPQQQSSGNSCRTCSNCEELIVSISICRKSPITVAHASTALQQESTSTCTSSKVKPPEMKQLVFPKPPFSSQPVDDFYLPDEGFQALKLDKLQSVHQFGEKLRRKLKPSKLTSSKLCHGFSDTCSSQSEVESYTATADVPTDLDEHSELTQASCVMGSDRGSQLPLTEGGQEMLHVIDKVSSQDVFVSSSLCDVLTSSSHHCVSKKMDGSEVVKTALLRHDVFSEAITDHSTAEPLRILHTAKSTIHYVAALVAGGVSVYSEQHKCTRTTPGTNWRKNSWCLGEGELLQESCLLCANGDLLLVVGGTLQECVARVFVNGGKEKHWYGLNLQRTSPATNRSLQCSALCSWVSGVRSSRVTVVSQSLPNEGATQAVDVWRLQKRENSSWCVFQWCSCPLPSSVTQLTSLSHVERTDSWVVGVADLTALLWDTAEGVLLKTVALGCSKPQPHPLAFHPVGVAAFNEKDTILLLLGCKWTEACPPLGEGSSPLLSDTPPCTCWLLAFEANGSTDSDSKCRLLQSYSPSTVDPHHTGLQQWYCWRETDNLFLTAVSGNLVLTWNLLSPTPCEEIVVTGDGDECISLKSARWLNGSRTLFTLDSRGELHVFSEQH